MDINIGIEKKGREEISEALNKYLADLNVLYTKLHNYHWNIEGEGFFTLHEVLEEIYSEMADEIDEVAERVLTLGIRPAASMKEYLELAELKEEESVGIQSRDVVKNVLDDFSILIGKLREGIEIADKYNDEASIDLMVGSLSNLEKRSWMLRAYLR